MNYIILDLEATCWETKSSKLQNEIIEIGAVAINDDLVQLGEFCTFIKPKMNPILSDFCTKLTTIQQSDVDNAPGFVTASNNFLDWIASFQEDYFLCSWGYYDKTQFAKDCRLHGLSTGWLRNHISIKHQHAEIHNLQRPMGMSSALRFERLKMEGTHHRGIDDARNIAKIFKAIFYELEFTT